MARFFKYILIIACGLAAASCYKDLGEYDYHEINEISIVPGTYSYSVGVPAEILISPEITQSLTQGTENLTYQWQRPVTGTEWKTVGDGPQYLLQISETDDQIIRLIFSVTDNNLGTTAYAEINVSPIIAFEHCWFLLQDIDGRAVLGNVDGEGEQRTVNGDIFAVQNNGQSMVGAPLFLGVQPYLRTDPPTLGNMNTENIFGVFTSERQYILEGATVREHPDLTYSRIVYGRDLTGDNMPQDNGTGPSFMKGQRNGFAIADGGTLWYALPDELALMYPLRLDPSVDASPYNYTAADACLSYASGYNLVMYDSMNGRFLSYNNTADYGMGYNTRVEIVDGGGSEDNRYLEFYQNNSAYLTAIGSNGQTNSFDPDNLPTGLVMDNMGMSTAGQSTSNVLAVGHVGSTFHVYELSMDAIIGNNDSYPRCSGSWEVKAEGDLSRYQSKVPVSTSSYFTRMFFYAAGNSVYRVDVSLSSPTVTMIWSSENPSDMVTGLKFKSDNEELYSSDFNDTKGLTHQLGTIVKREDGSCVLVEFNLTAAGEIEQDSAGEQSINVFGDGTDAEGRPVFSNVVDFVFSYRDAIY